MQTITFEASEIQQAPSPLQGLAAQTFSGADIDPAKQPDFRTENEKDAQGNAVVDPNTMGTFLRHLLSGIVATGQMLPFPKAAGGSGKDNPLFPSNILDAMRTVKQDADARWDKGDRVGATAKYIESVIPLLGPMMSQWGDQAQSGQYAALGGDVAGAALSMKAGGKATTAMKQAYPLANRPPTPGGASLIPPGQQTALEFARRRGVPLDAATASDNFAVKGSQQLADRSLGGSLVATRANAARTSAMARVGDELATQAHPEPVTLELAGEGVREALRSKVDKHTRQANVSYSTVRMYEGPETNVNMLPAKKALGPVYDQMKRQMPITQQNANPGLKALENILEGPDYAPLSQVDQDLSTIKGLAREHGGLAKAAVRQLSDAVEQAAKAGEPIVWQTLQNGREATRAKYVASGVLDTLKAEPVRTINALTAPKDAAINALRNVAHEAPDQVPVIARAYLEDLLAKPQMVAEWRKLGTQTKATLFPKAGQVAALDHFFTLTDRIAKSNVNPSGSGYVASLGAQGAMLWYDPAHAIPLQITGAALSKLLRVPAVVQLLTKGVALPRVAPEAVQIATTANLLREAKSAGVPLAFPKAADKEPQR